MEGVTVDKGNDSAEDDKGNAGVDRFDEKVDDWNEQEECEKLFKLSKEGKSKDINNLLVKLQKKKSKTKFLKQTDNRDNTPLHYAAKLGHLAVIKVLQQHGANLHAKGQNDLTVIQYAARYGENQETVWTCIKEIRDIDPRIRDNDENLIQGARYVINKKFKEWQTSEISEEDKYGYNILHHAIQNEHWKDIEVSNGDEKRNTFKGSFIIDKILNLKDIHVGDLDLQLNNPLHLSLMHKKPSFFPYIFERAKNSEYRNKLEKLAEALSNPNKDGKMPLHIACQANNMDMENKGITV